MAKYIVNKEEIQDYEYICFLMHQLRFYEISFEKYANPKDEDEIKDYRALIDSWLKDNVVKVTPQ